MDKKPSPQARRLVLLFWVLVVVFYFYLSTDYIRVSMADRDLGEYLRYVVNVSARDERPNKDIRSLITMKAQELDLPVHEEDITILGSAEKLTVAVNYTVNIDIPVFSEGFYTKNFSHHVSYREPR